MRLGTNPPTHLTYCLNIHPGETWDEHLKAIMHKTLAVCSAVKPDGPFGLGLRLGNNSADELLTANALNLFADMCKSENLYVFTINGFPYGQFHGTSVKQDVYRPDWREDARYEYTMKLATILARLLPDGVTGSISTVPGSYKRWIRNDGDILSMVDRLARSAAQLAAIRRQSGKDICLALEGEPDCFIETTAEACEFLGDYLLRHGTPIVKDIIGCDSKEASKILRHHICTCLDVAHAAVQFEDPAECLRQYARQGVRVGKIQLSAALEAKATEQARQRLAEFADSVYLHQVKARRSDGHITSFMDLPDALRSPVDDQEIWRVHFHVPLFFKSWSGLSSTSGDILGGFMQAAAQQCSHLEIETYTYEVIPEDLRDGDVVASIAKEYKWVGQVARTTSQRHLLEPRGLNNV